MPSDNSPYYNPASWDMPHNYVSLEVDDFIYYSLGTLRKGATISGEYATVFTSDDVGVAILNEYNKDRLILGYEPDYIFLRSGYYRSSFGPIEIPEKGEWFIFFVAAFDYDTITFSFGLEIDKGFPLVGVLIGGGVGVVALAIIIPLSVASSKKKKARMQGPELPGTTPSTQPGPVEPQMYGQAQQPPDSAIQGSNGSTKNFCDKCGMKLLPGAVFCPGCGSPLK